MIPVDLAYCAFAALDDKDRLSHEDVLVRAQLIEAACAAEAADESCPAVLTALWGLETAFTWTLTPSSRHACGVGQVVPGRMGTCAELAIPSNGLRAAWRVWLIKRQVARGNVERTFRFYNGHPKNKMRYGARGARLMKKITKWCADTDEEE